MKLSVAMCTFNGAKYVREQLESICNQELSVDEIVICDDGSTDETLNIANEIAKDCTNIKWNVQSNKSNIGVIKNFEKAISLCAGDIIFLSDQDDVWNVNKTKKIIEYFERFPKVNVFFTDADLIDCNGFFLTEHSLLDSVCLLPNIKYWNSGLQFEILMNANRATGATMAFRRRYIQRFLPFINDLAFLHDKQISLPAAQDGCLGVIEEKLIKYRQHGNNVIGVPVDNWIYTDGSCPNLLKQILIPSPVMYFHWKFKTARMVFYSKRSFEKPSISRKMKLMLLLPLYIIFYKRFWWRFFVSDMIR